MYLFLWLRLNWLQTDFGNDFLENGDVWLLLQIRSNWKAFPVDQIWEPKQRKIISVSIFTSNDFRPWKIEERERERERKKEEIATSLASRCPLTSPTPCRSRSTHSRCGWCRHRAVHDADDVNGRRGAGDVAISSFFLPLSLFYFPRPEVIWSENGNRNNFPLFWL